MGQAGEERGRGAGDEIDMTKSMELAMQGQRGDAQAVNELLTRYIPRMRRVLFIKIGRWQRARVDPDDVLQETLIVASRRLPELEVRTPASIYQWLAKIADYEIKNRLEYLHAEKRNPDRERHLRTDETDSSDSGVVVPFEGPSPSQFVARNELERQIDDCVEALEPPDYREVILMRDYYEADWESIRVKLGRPSIAAVQDLHARAQKRLRERLGRTCD
jgi:RNA polymerase sigma-70 factor, ECF subfamily